MERYNGSAHGSTEKHLVQGNESNPHLIAPPLEQIEIMDNKGVPEFIVDQGIYYPTATDYYGYYCTGFESPGEWDDHHKFFASDGQDLHYAGLQTESLPYVYYTPSYGYAQSPYNPYNPYIPGAIVGIDSPLVGTQPYYTSPTYHPPVSSPTYFPIIVQSGADVAQNRSPGATLLSTAASNASRSDGPSLKHNYTSASIVTTTVPTKSTFGHVKAEPVETASNSLTKTSEVLNANATSSKQPALHGSMLPGTVHSVSSLVNQAKGVGAIQAADHLSPGRGSSFRNSLKFSLPVHNLSDFGSNGHGWATADKMRSRLPYGGILNSVNGSSDMLGEQNRGPRTNRPKGQWISPISVKAYTTKAGVSNAQGNITIYPDQYNREDFSVNYINAKFFVIKSYSEDDVHKSIKYSVWSSTPNGNKRLDSAYEDAKKIAAGKPRGCPVFLFFSVNASGLFCGVAEMTGPVDFQKDMDFWQQDKWNGSFPVKWHMIKDVPNANFRHIILENNDNKPVTNSRDTQEINYRQGMEMLNIFKDYTLKTSILDDFMYYEERQKIMQEEKARLLTKSYDGSFFIPTFVPPSRTNVTVDVPLKANITPTKIYDANSSGKTVVTTNEQVPLNSDTTNSSGIRNDNPKHEFEDSNDVTSGLKVGSLTIKPKEDNAEVSAVSVKAVEAEPVDVVTVGSMPVKVNRFDSSSRILTVGTIEIDPKALKLGKGDSFASTGSTVL
ncbi:PREDICTED: uncharacterized protein LOC104611230 [Nelumbo nucifera]|uniref:YTH domain-containing family protein n=2 Tax=Nelumbo nucifera TaxID=4432 RepID=A0A1U8B6C8_NELNU|nr:PREDICTED: uncharacterized protein LOC104611230 [Nelumbo nucifera]XP_010276507.1 PREDICTED: uncharacterized protein LOC104611230 [Nelumbo nucifera]DAD33009.1 TPA_asm: hypothetical protein HUJ06_011860 [Nelumbo nucifera]